MVAQKLQNAVYTGRGITSRKDIRIECELQSSGHGIVFDVNGTQIEAVTDNVVNTLRNVTLGKDGTRLCIVEHILCAAALFGLDDLLIRVDGPEIPLGDGSSKFWIEMFEAAGWEPKATAATRTLPETVVCSKGDRALIAIPADEFSVTYLLDWNHPAIGKIWQTWSPATDSNEISHARTFGSMAEHQMLGIADEVVSLTPEGFSQPLRWPDEPVRHKLLDLVGDLVLAGVNPQSWKARFISIKGGHEMDVQMSKRLREFLK